MKPRTERRRIRPGATWCCWRSLLASGRRADCGALNSFFSSAVETIARGEYPSAPDQVEDSFRRLVVSYCIGA